MVRQLFIECMQISLVGPQVSFRNGAPQMSGGGIIFWAGEARISEVEEARRRWMDIVWSLQLESFILTKLTKPLVRQLSRPTGQLPKWCAPDVRGMNHFLGG